jgi:hypothetical protein
MSLRVPVVWLSPVAREGGWIRSVRNGGCGNFWGFWGWFKEMVSFLGLRRGRGAR